MMKVRSGLGALSLMVSLVLASSLCGAAEFDAARPTVLITGANRGIGYGFAMHYAVAGWNVIATTRSPESAAELTSLAEQYPRVAVEPLDVTDMAAMDALARRYEDQAIDVLINNAGVYGDPATQSWGDLSAASFDQVMAVNVFGPLKMAEVFTPHVARSQQKKIVAMTSGVSSIELGRGASDGIFYSISKTALNMAMRKAGLALRDRGITVALVAPGMVDTDMLALSRPGFTSGVTPGEVAERLAAIIDAIDTSYDGRPITAEGSTLPW